MLVPSRCGSQHAAWLSPSTHRGLLLQSGIFCLTCDQRHLARPAVHETKMPGLCRAYQVLSFDDSREGGYEYEDIFGKKSLHHAKDPNGMAIWIRLDYNQHDELPEMPRMAASAEAGCQICDSMTTSIQRDLQVRNGSPQNGVEVAWTLFRCPMLSLSITGSTTRKVNWHIHITYWASFLSACKPGLLTSKLPCLMGLYTSGRLLSGLKHCLVCIIMLRGRMTNKRQAVVPPGST